MPYGITAFLKRLLRGLDKAKNIEIGMSKTAKSIDNKGGIKI